MTGALLLATLAVTGAFVPRFERGDNPIALSGPARPAAYLEASGRRAAFFGHEDGTFEAWVYPLEILHDFDLAFTLRRYGEPLPGKGLVSSVDIRPESSTLRYAHDAFTIDATWFVPLDEAGGLVLLDVDTSEPLTVVVRFRPDLKLMWPAGLGGQYSTWDEAQKAYILTESTKRHVALIGSPLASAPPRLPAHNLPDAPTYFEISITKETAEKGLVPIVIAASVEGLEEARRTYERLLGSTEALYTETTRHYKKLREERTRIDTPDDALDLALEWGKVALDKGFVCNPELGCGLVAGLGPSGRSERPGFAWYFGGDAFVNALAITAYGDFETVRRSLEFLARRQRDDGKMMHELSQSAAYISWFEDYPYGYYHADTTPLYLVAARDYFLMSGDAAFIDAAWPSLKRAFAYCRSADENGDGLMDNTLSGLAAVETGALRTDTLLTDVYLASVWTEGAAAFETLARAVGDDRLAREAAEAHQKARASLNARFLGGARPSIPFALLKDGSVQEALTVWPAFALWRGGFDRRHPAVHAFADALASAELRADWGVRMLSRKSALYDPVSYNNGAVWPFVTGFAALALYSQGRDEAAWSTLDGLKALTFLGDRGYLPELLSGDRLHAVDASVPHQLFSSAGFVASLLRGLVGLSAEGLRPRVPAGWDRLDVWNSRWRDDLYDFHWRRSPDGNVSLRLIPHDTASGPSPSVWLDAESTEPLRLGPSHAVELPDPRTIALRPLHAPLHEGERSERLRVLETRLEADTLTARLEGRSGRTYRLRIDTRRPIASVTNGRFLPDANALEVSFPRKETDWTRLDVVVELLDSKKPTSK